MRTLEGSHNMGDQVIFIAEKSSLFWPLSSRHRTEQVSTSKAVS